MGELGVVQQYVYWSERRVLRWLEDQDLQQSHKTQRTVTTPGFGGKLPTVAWSREQDGFPSRPRLAKLVESKWGDLAVTDFDAPPPIGWAKGRGYVQLSDFIARPGGQAVMYTEVDTEHGSKVGICLFGSTENYADFVTDSGTPRQDGWTSSAAQHVFEYLRNGTLGTVWLDTPESIAIEALRIARTQGLTASTHNSVKPKDRGYTYGEVLDGEWFAEIYLDCSFEDLDTVECDRVLVGAPFWVRTPGLRAINLFGEYALSDPDRTDRDHNEGASAVVPGESLLGRFARWLYERTH